MKSREIKPPEAAEDPTDQELVARAQRQDIAAYSVLMQRYQKKIYALVYNMTSNKEDAEDLVQEVFYKAYTALKRFKGDSSFYTWVYRIAVNRAINYVKRRNKRSGISLDDMDVGVERDPAYVELSAKESPFRDATLSELQEKLNAALQTLSEKHRTVVVLHDIQGIPHDEIARMLKVSSGTVRSRLFYARQILQAELAEYAP
ncbi:MAG TPA: sigma-70 family RNA polymerase sigma factor [Kiritimatiellia bacterium]|nr:sigma-70 family RNA polymerase sigma factor [Kiritimatiellia bacterium]HMO99427.1 sigma-70 family RNA polymerase sigma factor [Kiritimatiellia bacterium]HMP97704.1 sigma-70 family RNA polymerase sigma factor [Kiritimatiellia bacterium]